jgi:hypothetical protein
MVAENRQLRTLILKIFVIISSLGGASTLYGMETAAQLDIYSYHTIPLILSTYVSLKRYQLELSELLA